MSSRFNHKTRNNQDSLLDERKVNLRKVLFFVIGLLSPFNMLVIDFRVYPIEIFFAIYVFVNYRVIAKIDINSSLSKLFFLFLVIILGITISSIRNNISVSYFIAEIINVIFLVSNIAFMYIAIIRQVFSYFIIGCLSGTVFFKIYLYQEPLIIFWKFSAVTLVFLIITYLRFQKLSKMQSLIVTGLTILALIISVINDSRIMAALFAIHLSLRLVEKNARGGTSALFTFFILIFALPIFYYVYVFLVNNGFMGQAAYIRYVNALQNPLGPIIGSRTNNLIALQYLFESPFWGHGAYAPFQLNSSFNSELLPFSEQKSLLIRDNYTPHSLLLRFWYSGGLISFIAAISIYLIFFRMIILSFKNNWSKNLPILMLTTINFFLNPISGFSRITLAGLLSLVFYAFVRSSHLNSYQKSVS